MMRNVFCLGSCSLAIAMALFTPFSVLANPLEPMEGWVYTVKSEPGTGTSHHGLPEGLVSQGGAIMLFPLKLEAHTLSLALFGEYGGSLGGNGIGNTV